MENCVIFGLMKICIYTRIRKTARIVAGNDTLYTFKNKTVKIYEPIPWLDQKANYTLFDTVCCRSAWRALLHGSQTA